MGTGPITGPLTASVTEASTGNDELPPVSGGPSYLLMEIGDNVLMETGDLIVLED